MKNFTYVLLLLIVTAACKTTSVTVQVLKPAQITIPSKIKTLAFINRSRPEKKERFKNILEGAVTGESVFADRRGAEECLKGVANKLLGSPRFQIVVPEGIDLRGSGTREFPPALDWNLVDEICKNNHADALITLETFDSNNNRQIGERQVEKKDGNKTVKYTEFTATLNVQIEAGWRIYFPAEKRIIDQNIYMDQRSWSHSDDAKKRAEAGLIPQESAVAEAGYYSGQQYAYRISPMWINVSRFYFRKGNSDFTVADRRGKVGDWKGAAEIWRKYVNDPNPKIAGNACYNMALACEIEDDLQAALEWANKSYVDYNNKKGHNYCNILKQRIYDQSRLDEQMK